jgi:RecA-family ATPase
VNKNANGIDVDSIIKAITAKYMDYDRIIIDNLGFITGKDAEDAYKELNYIIRSFKSFCHENNKNINLLHHFNKGNSKARKERDRTFADVLGTGKLEHDVDY